MMLLGLKLKQLGRLPLGWRWKNSEQGNDKIHAQEWLQIVMGLGAAS